MPRRQPRHHVHDDHDDQEHHGRQEHARSHRRNRQFAEGQAPDYSMYGYKSTGQMYNGHHVYTNAQGQQVMLAGQGSHGRKAERGGQASSGWGGGWGASQQVASSNPFGSWGGGSAIGSGNVTAAAQRYYGMGESEGNNRGADIAYFHQGTGARQGDAWCASFASQAARDGGVPLRKTASVADMSRQYAQRGALRRGDYTPHEGDMMFMRGGPTGRHVGIVKSVDSSGGITTIEGNAGRFPSRVQEVYHSAADVARRLTGFGDSAAMTGGGYNYGNATYASLSSPQTPHVAHHRRGHHGRH